MNRRITTLYTAFALCLAAQLAHADVAPTATPQDTIKAKMIENYLAIREAFKNADPDFLISLEAPDYTNVLKSGEVRPKDKADAMTRFMMDRIRKVHNANVFIKSIDISTDMQPQRVVIMSQQHLDADFLGPDNQIHRMAATLLSRDTWVYYDREWMLKRAEDMKSKFKNGGY
jgi:hypothetical protein